MPATRRPFLLLLMAGCSCALHAAPPPPSEEVVEAPPVLVTTDGPAQSWSDVKELKADADRGHPLALFEYAQLLERGDQVPANPAQALQLYRKAAEASQGEALFRLGKIHHDGLLGVAVDYRAALTYYHQAAAQQVPEAFYNIGAMLVSARGVKRDYVEGLAWLLVSVQLGAGAESGLDQVRQRLAARPERIAAAEKRAAVLTAQLAEGQLPLPGDTRSATKAAPKAPAPPPPAKMERPRPAVPAAQLPPPPGVTIERPTITIPPAPAPAPTP